MTNQRGTIANLIVKSNLLTQEYQCEVSRVSAFELEDIKRRNPLLSFDLDPTSYAGVTPAQRRQWDRRLWWGGRPIRLTEARWLDWLEAQAVSLAEHLETIAGHIEEEQAFEILYLVEQLRKARQQTTTLAPARARAPGGPAGRGTHGCDDRAASGTDFGIAGLPAGGNYGYRPDSDRR